MKMNSFRRLAMDFPLHLGQAVKNGRGFLLHPGGQFAGGNQLFNIGKIARVVVVMLMVMTVPMIVVVLMRMRAGVRVILPGLVGMFMSVLMIAVGMGMTVRVARLMLLTVIMVMVTILVIVFEVDIHFDAGDAVFLLLIHVQVIAFEL